MAITATLVASGQNNSNTNATSYATASLTFTAGRLWCAAISNRQSAATVATPTITNFAQIATVAFNTTGSPLERTTLFRSTSASNGVQTIDFAGVTQANCQWIFFEIAGCDTTGTNGANAIVQSTTNTDDANAGSGITVTLAAFGSAANGTVGAFGYAATSAQSITAGSGFAELDEQTATGAEVGHVSVEWRADNDTTVDITTSNTSAVAGIAAEIKATVITPKTLAAMGVGG